MRYTQYGKLEEQVSSVGFGGMRFDTDRPLQENVELVHHAFNRGINYFDTAPDYCGGESEKIFGEAFKTMPRDDFFVSTKAMPVKYDTADKARQAVEQSLEKMQVDKIDFYHVWCLRKMEHYELAMRPGGQYEGLLQCKEEGLIDHIVFSSHQPGNEIRQILEDDKFDGVLLGMNILNFPYRWDGVEAADKLGCGVVAMNPLAGGAIPNNEDRLDFLTRQNETPTEAALRFIVGCPYVDIALVGFTNKEHIDEACRIADANEPLSDEQLENIRRNLHESMSEICTGCGYCTGCPQNIPIPSYMQVYNDKPLFGVTDEEMKNKLKFHHQWGWLVGRRADAADCIECGICEEKCTQKLPIIERLKELAEWESHLDD
ncbi:MAG: aldo/keto reductase [Lentisphaeria bacterium]